MFWSWDQYWLSSLSSYYELTKDRERESSQLKISLYYDDSFLALLENIIIQIWTNYIRSFFCLDWGGEVATSPPQILLAMPPTPEFERKQRRRKGGKEGIIDNCGFWKLYVNVGNGKKSWISQLTDEDLHLHQVSLDRSAYEGTFIIAFCWH